MRRGFGFVVCLCVVLGLSVTSEVMADETTCDPLALDLTLTPQRTLIYSSLKETLKVQAALPTKTDAILIGDSLFAGWRTDLPEAFPATAVYDFAVGGDRIPNVLWRLENTDVSHLRPALAALLIGTNDLAAGTPSCAIVAGIEAIAVRLRHLWPATPVLVLTIPPRGGDFRALDDRRREINGAIAALNSHQDGVYAAAFDDDAFTCGQYGRKPAGTDEKAGHSVCDNYADDNLHFSTKGYVELGHMLEHAAATASGKDILH